MAETYRHRVLIVDDEEQIGKSIGRLLKGIGVETIYKKSGVLGIETIGKTAQLFSLIISDQRMPGMTGALFLEQVKKISPDTIRILITGYADMEAVINAVNRGSIHRFIAKPWNNDDFLEKIRYGLAQYEVIMENQRLFKLAKEQSVKLYALNLQLNKNADHQKKILEKLDSEITHLMNGPHPSEALTDPVESVTALLKEKNLLNAQAIDGFYKEILNELARQFQEIAHRNGLEFPALLLDQ